MSITLLPWFIFKIQALPKHIMQQMICGEWHFSQWLHCPLLCVAAGKAAKYLGKLARKKITGRTGGESEATLTLEASTPR